MQISVTPYSTASCTLRDELLLLGVVGVRRALALAEPAERTADLAHVREVDVAVDHERDGVAGKPRAQLVRCQPHVLDHLGPALGEQRRQLSRVSRWLSRAFSIARAARSARIGDLRAGGPSRGAG